MKNQTNAIIIRSFARRGVHVETGIQWSEDTDTVGGIVAVVPNRSLRNQYTQALLDAGYTVSQSEGNIGCDDEGALYLWVTSS